MARIPDETSFGARPRLQAQRLAPAPDLSAAPRAARRIAGALAQASEAITQREDESALLAARTQLDQWEADNVFDPAKGAVTRQGQDAFDLPQTLLAQFSEFTTGVADGLQNARQRRLFAEMAASRGSRLTSWANGHALRERDRYLEGQYQGALQSSTQRVAALAGQDLAAADAELQQQRLLVVGRLRSQGRSEDEIASAVRTQTSQSHALTLTTLLDDGNVPAARAYFAKYGTTMEPAQLVAARRAVNDATDTLVITAAVDDMLSVAGPLTRDSDFDRLTSLVEGAESGGRQFGAGGEPLTSPKGTVGAMQIMPETGPEAAKLAGVAWDEKRYREDPAYNRALGRAYLGSMMQRFGGDEQKALAAYNAGPTRVEETIRETEKYNKEFPNEPRTWLSQLPQETQDYVAKILPEYEAGKGARRRTSLATLDAALVDRYGSDPQKLAKAQQTLRARYAMQEQARQDAEDEVVGNVYTALDANGGDFSALPYTLRAQIPGKALPALRSFAASRTRGVEPDTNWATYGELVANPTLLQRTNLQALRGQLGDTEFKELLHRKTQLETGALSAGSILSNRQIVDNSLGAAGIETRDTKMNDREKADYGRFYSLLASRGISEKSPPADVERETRKLLTDVTLRGQLFGTNAVRAAQLREEEIKRVVVPPATRQKILDGIAYKNRLDPTNAIPSDDEQVKLLYLRDFVGVLPEGVEMP